MEVPRFNGSAVWATLTPEEQAEIGAAALEYASGNYAAEQLASDMFLTPLGRAAQEAWDKATNGLIEAVAEVVPRVAFVDETGCALIPSSLGPYCRDCGCSEDDACPEGCGWAEDDLCTACAGKAL